MGMLSRFGRPVPAGSVICASLLLAAGKVWAGPVVTLDADARTRVANDEMVVSVSAERDGANVAQLNEAVLRDLNDAIAQARRNAAIKPRLAGVYTSPMYNQGKPSGYRVSGQVELVSTDFVALSALAGELGQKLQLTGVSFRLTPDKRAREEQALLNAAAHAFRSKALDTARAFDFKDYDLKTMTVGRSASEPIVRMRAVAYDAMPKAAAAPMPAEGGDSDVVVSISGTVELR